MTVTRRWPIAAGLVLLAAVPGCGQDSSGGFAPAPTVMPTPARLTIEGPSSIAPGTSAQFVATATATDGVVRDVTTQVSWSTPRVGAAITIEQDASGNVQAVGESSDGPLTFGATFQGGALVLNFGSSEWDYFGPAIRFHSPAGVTVDVVGSLMVAPTSPATFAGAFEGTLFDLAFVPAPSCLTPLHPIEMRRR